MRDSSRRLFVPLLAAACIAMAPPADTAAAQQAVTVQLGAQNNSGVTGTATLTPQGNQTRVVLNLQNAPGPHPAHIHAGTCENLNPQPAFPLSNVMNGTSETTVNASVSQIQGAQHAINVHKSPQEVPVYVSCGTIAMAAGGQAGAAGGQAAGSAQPGQLPRTGEADFALPGLAALGALLLLGGVRLAFRRRSA